MIEWLDFANFEVVYKWLRFKDIVYGFEKLKKLLKKNEIEWDVLQDQKS